MAMMEIAKEIVRGREFEVTSCSLIFGIGKGEMIKLKEDFSPEEFSAAFSDLCGKLGEPKFVHSSDGYIWEKDGEVLVLTTIQKSYECEVLAFIVYKKMPIGKKIGYEEYKQIVATVKEVFSEHGLDSKDFIHYRGGKFTFWELNDNVQVLLVLKQNALEFYYSTKEQSEYGFQRVVPRYVRKERISLKDLSTVKRALNSCFTENK